MFLSVRFKTLSLLAGTLLFCGAASAQNWLMDGGDNIRSGWQKDEHILTESNVGKLKLLWKIQTDAQPHALHTLMGPLVVQGVPMPDGKKEIVYVLGASDELLAVDPAKQKVVWEKHFTYAALPPRRGPDGQVRAQQTPSDPKHYNFLAPQGSTDVPAIGDEEAGGVRPIYVVDGGGVLHTLSDVTGDSLRPDINMGATSKFALQLYQGQIIYGARPGIVSIKVDGSQKEPSKTVGFGGGGGLWGRRGPVITSDGTVWTTTGDGQVNLTDPNNMIIGNSVVGFKKDGDSWVLKDWFTPANWDWLRQRDLDPNNTPTVFNWHGKEYMAASGKECRLFLLDPQNMGGPKHETPLYRSPLVCNQIVDFQNAGSWGALTSWEDAKGTRWVLMPFWGPADPDMKFPIENTPVTKEGGEAAFKMVEKDGKPELEPVWVSRDMHRGEPSIVANGMVFAYGSGENTQQSWKDIGLNFDSTIRAARGQGAVIHVLDGQTGKELWNSGDTIKSFSHFSSLTVANGKLYLGTYDGILYCFGL